MDHLQIEWIIIIFIYIYIYCIYKSEDNKKQLSCHGTKTRVMMMMSHRKITEKSLFSRLVTKVTWFWLRENISYKSIYFRCIQSWLAVGKKNQLGLVATRVNELGGASAGRPSPDDSIDTRVATNYSLLELLCVQNPTKRKIYIYEARRYQDVYPIYIYMLLYLSAIIISLHLI